MYILILTCRATVSLLLTVTDTAVSGSGRSTSTRWRVGACTGVKHYLKKHIIQIGEHCHVDVCFTEFT